MLGLRRSLSRVLVRNVARQLRGAASGLRTPEEVIVQVSQLVEDNPSNAARFAECISKSDAERLQLACASVDTGVQPPSQAQLNKCAAAAAVPFIGFGVLDNAVMIVCGEAIDATLCVTFNLSTMTAAALGNTFSDAAGVFSGGVVEDAAERAGFAAPSLSRAQEDMSQTRAATRLGQLIGVIVGCLIGMFPLLLIDTKKGERLRRERDAEQKLDDVCKHAAEGVSELLNSEAVIVMLIDPDEPSELYTRGCWAGGQHMLLEVRAPVGEGIKGTVAKTGRAMNIADVRQTPFWRAPPTPGRDWCAENDDPAGSYMPSSWERVVANYRRAGVQVRNVVCMPIVAPASTGEAEEVLGVVEVINRKTGRFGVRDEEMLAALCSHIATSIAVARGVELDLSQTLRTCERRLKLEAQKA
eukprot:TRINITY_DN4848_c0_g2_i1.p1 TRINITY_DN4848_c0_g2~~TRINITY_DN4848_c0_g2_i1.p1  ORF type:complete len:433 (+),score=94.60 TRINITY_DN4848_c0_g2_i1:58-1299(+)